MDLAIQSFAEILRLKNKLEDTAIYLWVNIAKVKVKNRVKSWKTCEQIWNTSLVLQKEEVKQYLKDIQKTFCIVLQIVA